VTTEIFTMITKISFDVSTTNDQKSLNFEVQLDKTIVYSNNEFCKPETVTFEVPDDDSEHELNFILKNKTVDHTQIDDLGKIITDCNIKIKNIKFDDIVLPYNALNNITYTHDCNGTKSLATYPFFEEMGCNGIATLKFSTPVYLWLLENM
jgi:hypothetical protein